MLQHIISIFMQFYLMQIELIYNTVSSSCTSCWLGTFINCKMNTPTALANISLLSYNYHCFCACLMRFFKIFSLGNIQVCNTVLLAIIITVSSRSPELTNNLPGSLYPLIISSHFSNSTAPGKHHSNSLSLLGLVFLDYTEVIPYITCLSPSDSFHSAKYSIFVCFVFYFKVQTTIFFI